MRLHYESTFCQGLASVDARKGCFFVAVMGLL